MKYAVVMLKRINPKSKNGFTLVEVLTSFAVLAIVSVALLQMFVVSTRTNRIAYDTDKANALCIEMSEQYKADPGFLPATVTTFSTSTAISGGTVYTRYYNSLWSAYTTTEDAQSTFRLDIDTITTPASELPESYYPKPAWTGDLGTASTLRTLAVYNSGASFDYTVQLDGIPLTLADYRQVQYIPGTAETSGTAIVPIQLHCDRLTASFIQINVNNTARIKDSDSSSGEVFPVVADIYVCDIPSGTAVSVNPITGISTENKIKTGQTQSEDYAATISAIRLSDGLTLSRNMVKKHLVK